MAWKRWRSAACAATLALAACSTLPDYAAPKGGIADPSTVDLSDVIAYRALSRGDFKAAQPPPEYAAYADRTGAATCGRIITTPETQVFVEPVRSNTGGLVYRASPHRLGFRAVMDRKCSWWNPKDLGLPQEYILEHEQIHFALFELDKRRLNASIPKLEAELAATAASAETAAQIVQQRLEKQLMSQLKRTLARNREFDEDTSMGHRPEAQKRWWNLVQAELAASSP
jgi:hypothetical protein